MSTLIAFIGVGNMGCPMAENLMKAGQNVKVFDVSKNYNFSRIQLEKKKFINFHITNYYIYKTYNEMKTRIKNIKKERHYYYQRKQ